VCATRAAQFCTLRTTGPELGNAEEFGSRSRGIRYSRALGSSGGSCWTGWGCGGL
jgi:hypothetical protein